MRKVVLSEYDSPFGLLRLAASEKGVHALALRESRRDFMTAVAKAYPDADLAWAEAATTKPGAALVRWLDAYFAGKRPGLASVPLAPAGTAFQSAVWKALARIPFGALATYGEIAGRVDAGGARAVGQAVGANPLPILIPCHRVVAADGKLGGFSCGVDVKAKLLRLEGFAVDLARGRVKAAGR
ncbi:MAG: methylated-DNA--[protein]-cysteine S-methyltransferase [Myxococcales bacterium]|nr:MAG: methylated-DNA--[protein]-cysteine S-methyltransferase [Myxococcales bacterium]